MTRLNRRTFLAASAAAGAGLLCRPPAVRGAAAALASDAPDHRARPTPAQVKWQNDEIGVIFHLDMPGVAGEYAGNNATRRVFDPDQYQPAKLDTDQWVAAAQAAGAGYAVFTATHFNGFMQWPSDLYPYSVRQSSWRGGQGDVVGDFVRSCRQAGLRPALYLSTHRNAWWTVWGHYVDWGKGRGTAKQAAFNRVAERMVEELCSRYGPLAQIWFDAGVKTPAEGGPDVLPIFERWQPDSVFYHNVQRSDVRWIGNEQGRAGDPCWATMPGRPGELSHNSDLWKPLLATGDPDGAIWSPGMVDIPLRGANGVHDWFWRPGHEQGVYPLEQLLEIYERSVGRNCNLVIGTVVNAEGLVPAPDARRLHEFGAARRRRFGRPLAQTQGRGRSLELVLPERMAVGWADLAEDIRQGERVRGCVVEARRADGSWEKVAQAASVGHRRLHGLRGVVTDRLRVRVTAAVGEPIWRHFRAFGPA